MYHFTHPCHPLQEVYIDKEFECEGCSALGHGKRYRCTVCPSSSSSSFQLHERCATCPSSITLEFHPKHHLTLVSDKKLKVCICTICGDEVNGLHYTCNECGFHIHPLCTELPMRVQHVLHPNHVLTLTPPSEDGRCMDCGGPCRKDLWRYRCGHCKNVDAHIECAFMAESASSPPAPANYNQKSPPLTALQGHRPPSSPGHPPATTWYQQQPSIGWYQPPPPPSMQFVYHYANNYNYYYYPPYPNYNAYIPQVTRYPYPMQQIGPSSSSGNGKSRKRIYTVLSVIAAKVAIGALTGVII